jgi:hypothetical protein
MVQLGMIIDQQGILFDPSAATYVPDLTLATTSSSKSTPTSRVEPIKIHRTSRLDNVTRLR